MSGQIHKDVNAVGANLSCDHVMAFAHRDIPVIREISDPLGHVIRFLHLGIAENLHPGFVMRLQQSFQKKRAGVVAKIRRHIPNAEPLPRIPLIGMGQYFIPERHSVHLIPTEMFLKHLIRGAFLAILQCEKEITIGFDIIRFQREYPAIAGNGLFHAALFTQCASHVMIIKRIIRIDIDGFADFTDGNIMLIHLKSYNSMQMQRIRMLGIDSEDFLIDILRLGQFPGLVISHSSLEFTVHIKRRWLLNSTRQMRRILLSDL